MNYIHHLNAFFEKAEGDHWLTPDHQSLYLALFRTWNEAAFKQTIKINRDSTMQKSKIYSKAMYIRYMQDLADTGYIHYFPSKHRNGEATVMLVPFSNTGNSRDHFLN
jgi:hypothetical protein